MDSRRARLTGGVSAARPLQVVKVRKFFSSFEVMVKALPVVEWLMLSGRHIGI
jgi:hypothetical protein